MIKNKKVLAIIPARAGSQGVKNKNMRIIGGRFSGRRLVSFTAEHIRPTTDRVKESLFNKLAAYWDGARVLDLFSGTGNLTIEAISWGADSVESVELNPKSISIM